MGFFHFVGRHIGAATVMAVGIVLAALGYADQAKNIMTGFEAWQLQATGAALFAIAVIMILYRWDQEHRARLAGPAAEGPSQPALPSSSGIGKSAGSRAAPLFSPPPPADGRVFLGEAITPVSLMDMHVGKTRMQASRETGVYVGRWITLAGKVFQVSEHSTFLSVGIVPEDLDTSREPSSRHVSLYFRSQREHIELLKKGDLIRVRGRIDKITEHDLELEDCELIL